MKNINNNLTAKASNNKYNKIFHKILLNNSIISPAFMDNNTIYHKIH